MSVECVIHQFSVDKSLVEQMTRAVSSISKRNIGLRDSFSRLLSYVQSGQMNGVSARVSLACRGYVKEAGGGEVWCVADAECEL